MTSFQTKISLKSLTKRENKNYRFVSFLPDGYQKIKKKQQKNSKNSKIPLRLHFMPKEVGKGRKREKQSFRFVPTRGIRDNSKKL